MSLRGRSGPTEDHHEWHEWTNKTSEESRQGSEKSNRFAVAARVLPGFHPSSFLVRAVRPFVSFVIRLCFSPWARAGKKARTGFIWACIVWRGQINCWLRGWAFYSFVRPPPGLAHAPRLTAPCPASGRAKQPARQPARARVFRGRATAGPIGERGFVQNPQRSPARASAAPPLDSSLCPR